MIVKTFYQWKFREVNSTQRKQKIYDKRTSIKPLQNSSEVMTTAWNLKKPLFSASYSAAFPSWPHFAGKSMSSKIVSAKEFILQLLRQFSISPQLCIIMNILDFSKRPLPTMWKVRWRLRKVILSKNEMTFLYLNRHLHGIYSHLLKYAPGLLRKWSGF